MQGMRFVARQHSVRLHSLLRSFPAVLLVGPQQCGKSAQFAAEYLRLHEAGALEIPGYLRGQIVPFVALQGFLLARIVGQGDGAAVAEGQQVEIAEVRYQGLRGVFRLRTQPGQRVETTQGGEYKFAASLQRIRGVLQDAVVHLVGFHQGESPLTDHNGQAEMYIKTEISSVPADKVYLHTGGCSFFPGTGQL